MTTRRSITSLATTAAAALALTSAASAFPDKLLQFVTPYPFGGSHVLHASIITTAAEPHFGQPMISVIRTGAAVWSEPNTCSRAPPTVTSCCSATRT
jgi:tripartite-type tricarboxylate transporter receptor subunit TctC